MELRPGTVFRPRAVGSHTHIVVTAVTPQGKVLTVNWTTLDDECVDDACILGCGDHPAITHPSTVAYSRRELRDAAKLRLAFAAGLLELLPPLPPAVLNRVLSGARHSPELGADFKSLLPPEST